MPVEGGGRLEDTPCRTDPSGLQDSRRMKTTATILGPVTV